MRILRGFLPMDIQIFAVINLIGSSPVRLKNMRVNRANFLSDENDAVKRPVRSVMKQRSPELRHVGNQGNKH